MELSIIVPCFNEERAISNTILQLNLHLDSLNFLSEIIAIDDGSHDKTFLILQDLKKSVPRLKVYKHIKNKGLGAAFWTGVDKSRGSIIAMLPGDGENQPNEVLKYISFIDKYDYLVPYIINPSTRSKCRVYISSIYTRLVKLFFKLPFRYTNGTVIYKRRALDRISFRAKGFFYQTAILNQLAQKDDLQFFEFASIICKSESKSSALNWKNLSILTSEAIMLFFHNIKSFLTNRFKSSISHAK